MPPQSVGIAMVVALIAVSKAMEFLIAWLGGWRRLAKSYRCEQPVEGTVWRFQSASLRWPAAYNSCLTVTANAEGLRLAGFFLLRLSHPPLFFPWAEISLERGRSFFRGEYVTFTFARAPDVPVRLKLRLMSRIAEAVGRTWPQLAT